MWKGLGGNSRKEGGLERHIHLVKAYVSTPPDTTGLWSGGCVTGLSIIIQIHMCPPWCNHGYCLSFPEESAESEPAWEGAGQEVGLKVWRIDVSTSLSFTPCRHLRPSSGREHTIV